MGGTEQLGIVAQRQRDRETYGRFAYRAPVPGLAKAHTIIADAKAGAVERKAGPPEPPPAEPVEVAPAPPLPLTPAQLREQIGRLKLQLTNRERELQELRDKINPQRTLAAIPAVIDTYCRILAELGYTIDGKPFDKSALLERRRSQVYSRPRHVCIKLIRQLSGTSTSITGRVFGIDHTSVLHAVWRTPDHLERNPMLAEAHARTLAAFEAQQ